MKYNNQKRGFALIEIIVGSAIAIGVFLALGSIGKYSLLLVTEANLRVRSSFLAAEGVEAVKIMRDTSWSKNIATLNPGTAYYLSFATSTNMWATSTAPALIDGIFTQTVTLQNVSRDASDKIIASGGTNDPNTKKVTATVSYSVRGQSRQDSIATYMTNLFNN